MNDFEVREVIAEKYSVYWFDDFGNMCDVTFVCPFCGERVNTAFFLTPEDEKDNTILYKTIGKCRNCHKQCFVSNPDPQP